MDTEGCKREIRALIRLVESLGTQVEIKAGEGRRSVLYLFDAIAATPGFLTEAAARILPQTRNSLADFYNPLYSRGWTRHYALVDLRELERVCCDGAEVSGA